MKGFTFVELLTVIAILSLLVALLLPVLSVLQKKSYFVTDATNLKQLGQAYRTYCSDYDDVMPFAVTGYQKHEAKQGRVSFWNYNEEICEKAQICTTNDILESVSIKSALAPYGLAEKQWESPLDFISEDYRRGHIGTYEDTWYETTGSSYNYDWANALRGKRLSDYKEPSRDLLFWSEMPIQNKPILWHVAYADGHIKIIQHEVFYTALENQGAGY